MINSAELENNFFRSVCLYAIRWRWLVLVGSLVVLMGMLVVIRSSLRIDTSIESFSEKGSTAQLVLEEYRAEFGRDGMYIVVIEGDVFTPAFFKKLSLLHQEILGLTMDLASIEAADLHKTVPSSTKESEQGTEPSFAFDDDEVGDGFDAEPSF